MSVKRDKHKHSNDKPICFARLFVVVEKIEEEGELVRFVIRQRRGGGRTMEVPIPRNFAQFGRLG